MTKPQPSAKRTKKAKRTILERELVSGLRELRNSLRQIDKRFSDMNTMVALANMGYTVRVVKRTSPKPQSRKRKP